MEVCATRAAVYGNMGYRSMGTWDMPWRYGAPEQQSEGTWYGNMGYGSVEPWRYVPLEQQSMVTWDIGVGNKEIQEHGHMGIRDHHN